jgi:hypothetical protein
MALDDFPREAHFMNCEGNSLCALIHQGYGTEGR